MFLCQELENLASIWDKVINQDRDRSCVLVVLPIVLSKKRLQGRSPDCFNFGVLFISNEREACRQSARGSRPKWRV